MRIQKLNIISLREDYSLSTHSISTALNHFPLNLCSLISSYSHASKRTKLIQKNFNDQKPLPEIQGHGAFAVSPKGNFLVHQSNIDAFSLYHIVDNKLNALTSVKIEGSIQCFTFLHNFCLGVLFIQDAVENFSFFSIEGSRLTSYIPTSPTFGACIFCPFFRLSFLYFFSDTQTKVFCPTNYTSLSLDPLGKYLAAINDENIYLSRIQAGNFIPERLSTEAGFWQIHFLPPKGHLLALQRDTNQVKIYLRDEKSGLKSDHCRSFEVGESKGHSPAVATIDPLGIVLFSSYRQAKKSLFLFDSMSDDNKVYEIHGEGVQNIDKIFMTEGNLFVTS